MNVVLDGLWLLCRLLYYYVESFYRLFVSPPAKNIANEVALITGAGRGIGREIALALAKLGAKVAVCDINETGCMETARIINEAGGQAKAYLCDITSIEKVAEMAMKVRKDLGDVDILVNNAGVATANSIFDKREIDIQRAMNVNVLALFWTVRQFLPSMITKQHGHIVVVASMVGRVPFSWMTDYSASKHAAHGFSEALKEDLLRMNVRGVDVTIVYPSFVDTGMVHELSDSYEPRNRFNIPNMKPQEVADATVYGILHRQHHVYSPGYLVLMNLLSVMPVKASRAIKDFLQIGLFEVKK